MRMLMLVLAVSVCLLAGCHSKIHAKYTEVHPDTGVITTFENKASAAFGAEINEAAMQFDWRWFETGEGSLAFGQKGSIDNTGQVVALDSFMLNMKQIVSTLATMQQAIKESDNSTEIELKRLEMMIQKMNEETQVEEVQEE